MSLVDLVFLDYFHPLSDDFNKVIYSCDMLYLEFTYDDLLSNLLQSMLNDVNNDLFEIFYFHKNNFYSYAHLFKIYFPHCKSSLIIKIQISNKKRGIIEFNPNKLCNNSDFMLFFERLSLYLYNLKYKKMDLACDLLIDRNKVILVPDKRKYTCLIYGSKTEYLGVRNNNNHVKVYDKKHESDLPHDLTRVEITIEKDNILNFPVIKIPDDSLHDLRKLSETDFMTLKLLCNCPDAFLYIKDLKQTYARKKWSKLLECSYKSVVFMEDYYLQILSDISVLLRFKI